MMGARCEDVDIVQDASKDLTCQTYWAKLAGDLKDAPTREPSVALSARHSLLFEA